MNGSSTRVLLAALLIAVAGICYSSWVLEFLWASPLDPMTSFLSELDAAHRPHRGVYVAGDVITGTSAILACVLMLIPRPQVRGVVPLTTVIAFGAFGASTVADALLPIECIPGIDPNCPSEPSGLLPQLHHVHALTSTLAVFSIFITMIAGTIAAHRDQIWPLLRRVGLAVFVIVALATIWMLAADNLHGDFRLGLAQRIQVGGMTVWVVLWAVAVARSRKRHSPESPR